MNLQRQCAKEEGDEVGGVAGLTGEVSGGLTEKVTFEQRLA